jgi:hypothetical protein
MFTLSQALIIASRLPGLQLYFVVTALVNEFKPGDWGNRFGTPPLFV